MRQHGLEDLSRCSLIRLAIHLFIDFIVFKPCSIFLVACTSA